ncbi:segregation and condensation protein A [Streptomyces sp. enrichment culture]|uniref:segregation and condensation protein A n=1 Tax=Streptomyces sp. enrichment culture TaxID=1795815 RepID=UPI003F55764A
MPPADPPTPRRRRPLGRGAGALPAPGRAGTADGDEGTQPPEFSRGAAAGGAPHVEVSVPPPQAPPVPVGGAGRDAAGAGATERPTPGGPPGTADGHERSGPPDGERRPDGPEPPQDMTPAGEARTEVSAPTAEPDTGEVAPPRPGAGRAGAGEAPPGRDATRAAPAADAGGEANAAGEGRFRLVLDNFEGPFDLLLQLISRHKLDVTEIALSRVTDEFLAHLRAMGPDGDLDQTTEFLVVAATLLDLKAARLLPAAEIEDEGDLALLEARDLLFARLLQYRAYKRVAEIFAERLTGEALRHPRTVGLEPHHAQLLPEVMISVGPEGFAALAVKAMQPKPVPQVYVDHIHAPLVSVREQAALVVERLRDAGQVSFAELTADAPDTLTVVARFLALLELYRERAVHLDQPEALGPLLVRWSAAPEEAGRTLVTDEFDQEAPHE